VYRPSEQNGSITEPNGSTVGYHVWLDEKDQCWNITVVSGDKNVMLRVAGIRDLWSHNELSWIDLIIDCLQTATAIMNPVVKPFEPRVHPQARKRRRLRCQKNYTYTTLRLADFSVSQ
jgi:hypothetical protein